jgi:hypothetical protein
MRISQPFSLNFVSSCKRIGKLWNNPRSVTNLYRAACFSIFSCGVSVSVLYTASWPRYKNFTLRRLSIQPHSVISVHLRNLITAYVWKWMDSNIKSFGQKCAPQSGDNMTIVSSESVIKTYYLPCTYYTDYIANISHYDYKFACG